MGMGLQLGSGQGEIKVVIGGGGGQSLLQQRKCVQSLLEVVYPPITCCFSVFVREAITFFRSTSFFFCICCGHAQIY